MNCGGESEWREKPPDWKRLPVVVLVKVFYFLPLQQRLDASSTCKHWRQAVFSPKLWPSMNFDCNHKKQSMFRSQMFAKTLRHTVIHLNSHSPAALRNGLKVLDNLKLNERIQSFIILPTHLNVGWSEECSSQVLDRYISAIETICLNAKNLEHFALGCIEELLDHAEAFLILLGQRACHHQRRISTPNQIRQPHSTVALPVGGCVACHYENHDVPSLKSLHLASVKSNLEVYGLIDIHANLFQPLKNLHTLSLDYDYLSNQLLQILASPDRSPLSRFDIHVHSYEEDTPPILDRCWRNLVLASPDLEVGVALLHSYEAVQNLLLILRPSMPLTHFKSFFCQSINGSAINFIGKNYRSTLKSIHIVDGFVEAMPMSYENLTQTEDPFVMLAWKCAKLESLKILGYEFLDDNLIAIARLRGPGLMHLEIPQLCILSLEPEELEEDDNSNEDAVIADDNIPNMGLMGVLGKVGPEFNAKMSDSLGYDWAPLDDDHIPDCVWFPYDVFDNSPETYYLPSLLEGQIPTQ